MHAQMTHVHPLVFIRRNRFLPVSGVVNVRVGQKVSPTEVIAETTIPTRHYLVDVYRTLGLKTPEEAEKLIERKPGESLVKNDIIAETGGLFSRVIRTPGPGKIISILGGQVLIEAESRRITLQAGMSGTVTEILENTGAVIETNGALIQGVWGNDKLGCGPLQIEGDLADQELKSSSLGLTSRGLVILAGFCASPDVFTVAASIPVSGLILGSMSASLIQVAEAQPYPIIVLGGFGKFGMDPVSKKLLVSNAGREASINAAKWDRLSGIRPEILISLPAEGDPYREQADFSAGQTVRVHASAHRGKVGVIEKVISGLSVLPGGLRASSAAIIFEDNEKAVVPLVNLDIIDLKNTFLGKTE